MLSGNAELNTRAYDVLAQKNGVNVSWREDEDGGSRVPVELQEDFCVFFEARKANKDTGDDQGRNYRHEKGSEQGSFPKEVEREEAGAQ